MTDALAKAMAASEIEELELVQSRVTLAGVRAVLKAPRLRKLTISVPDESAWRRYADKLTADLKALPPTHPLVEAYLPGDVTWQREPP